MAAPPEKKDSTTITMVVKEWVEGAEGYSAQISPVYRINGFPFNLRMDYFRDHGVFVSVSCNKSNEAELWMCTATITQTHEQNSRTIEHVFCSWDLRTQFEFTGKISPDVGSSVQVTIDVKEDGNSWRLCPIPDSTNSHDGILVIGMEKKEIRVNKQCLASLSPYFDRLFFGNFKENNMDKISIGDVEYEEFCNIINIIYGSFMTANIRDENVHRVLDLADRFDLKIVEEKVVNYLLSGPTSYTLVQKLILSQERNIPSLKNLSLNTSKLAEFKWMKKAPEYADFSDALKLEILDRMLDLAQECCLF